MPDTQPDQFSQIIESVFSKLGVNPPFIETFLLCDRFYVGRKFRAGGFQVIWWVEKNLVEVFDEDEQVVDSINLEQNLGMTA